MEKLDRYLERLPESASVLKLKTGTATKHVLEAIYVFEGTEPRIRESDITPELIERMTAAAIIIEEAENLGWGVDFTHIRLHAYDADMSHLKSLSLPRSIEAKEAEGESAASIGHLTHGLLAMSAEVRRTLHIVTESLAHRESMHADIIESLLEAKRDQAEAEANHMRLENYLDEEGIHQADSFKATAVEQLGQILQTVMNAKSGNGIPTADQLKNWIQSNPDMLNSLFEDKDLMDSLISAYMARGEQPSN